MLAPPLQAGDAGSALCLAERGSDAPSAFRDLIPHPRSTREPLRLRCWEEGLGRRQLNQAETLRLPAWSTVSSTATPSWGRETRAKDTLIHRPSPPHHSVSPHAHGVSLPLYRRVAKKRRG